MWKKALTPISVVVLLVGIGLILYSTLGGDDSNSGSNSSAVSVVPESVPVGSTPGETMAPADSGAPSGTTVAPDSPSSAAPSSTGAPGSSSSSIFFPSFPSFTIPPSVFVPTFPSFTMAPPPMSFLTIAPGIIDVLSCNSFQSCAQKLYDSWKSGNLSTATNYATPAAVAALTAFPNVLAPGPWPGSVSASSATSFIASSSNWLFPHTIRFNFVAGQSGFKVQTVQIS